MNLSIGFRLLSDRNDARGSLRRGVEIEEFGDGSSRLVVAVRGLLERSSRRCEESVDDIVGQLLEPIAFGGREFPSSIDPREGFLEFVPFDGLRSPAKSVLDDPGIEIGFRRRLVVLGEHVRRFGRGQ